MSKKFMFLVFGCIGLVLSVLAVVIYFVVTGGINSNTPITRISTDDLVIYKGSYVENFYEVNVDDAEITFAVDKEGIININKDRLEGCEVGEVDVLISAESHGSIASDTFKVTVIDRDYSYTVEPVIDCTFEDNTLFMPNDECFFKFQILDTYGKVFDTHVSYEVIGNGKLDSDLGRFVLITSEDCVIKFYAEEIDFEVVINVIHTS